MTAVSRVTAINTAPDSENRMHDDTVARQYGFAFGGLVPGVDVFEYMVRALGPAWLAAGQGGELRLLKPCFDGEEIEIRATEGEVQAGHPDNVRAVLRTVAPAFPGRTKPAFQEPPPKAERPQASERTLAAGVTLGSLQHTLAHDSGSARARELLELANEILMRNVVLAPWIHTGSRILWLEAIASAREIELRGSVSAEFEKKGHRLVSLDLYYLDRDSGVGVAHIEHTAIWLYRPAR